MIKTLLLSALILATTATQALRGMHPVMSSEIVKSKIKKLEADISAMSGNLAYATSRGSRNEEMLFIRSNSLTSRSSRIAAIHNIAVDATLHSITPVDQVTIKAPGTDTTLVITGNGFFRVDPTIPLLERSNIDPITELTKCLEAQEAYNRIVGEYRAKVLARQNLANLLNLSLRLLDNDIPHPPTTATRRQMNRVLNELLSSPPQLRHIVPPEK